MADLYLCDLQEECILNILEGEGISIEVRKRIIDDIRFGFSEFNTMESYVPNSNYLASREREIDNKIVVKDKEHQSDVAKLKQEMEDLKSWNRRRISFLESEVERYKSMVNNNR